MPNTVDLAVGPDTYTELEVPDDCNTIGHWKELVGQGLLGDRILYATKIACRGDKEGSVLDDAAPLPASPKQLHIGGPGCVISMVEIALRKKAEKPKGAARNSPSKDEGAPAAAPPPPPPPPAGDPDLYAVWPHLGGYRVGRSIGEGMDGVCVYEATRLVDGVKVALKWPARVDEAEAMREIAIRADAREGGLIGISRLLGQGRYKGSPWVVTELLGRQIGEVFQRIEHWPFTSRWNAVSVIGRLMLRRLEIVHACGYVHCDVSPENILQGAATTFRAGSEAVSNTPVAPYLVDFGLARRHLGGGPMSGALGSAEWSSIRSADGGERRPEDDLEALGWVLASGLVGDLPWFDVLSEAYEDWNFLPARANALRRVQGMKARLLEHGWESADWQFRPRLKELPQELLGFLAECRKEVVPPMRVDYQKLAELLGGSPGLGPREAEQADLRQYNACVPRLPDSSHWYYQY